MSMTVTVDASEFESTMANYLAVTGYTLQQGMLYQLRNWLVKASQAAYGTDAHFIANPDPKLVAWLMSTGPHGERTAVKWFGKNTIDHRWRQGRLRKDGTRGPSYWVGKGGGGQQRQRGRFGFYSREQARAFAVRHFDMRKRAARWLGAFLGAMKRRVNQQGDMGGGTVENENKRLGGAVQTGLFTTGDKTATFGITAVGQFSYKHATTAAKKVTTEESANRLERIILKALNDCKSEIIPNMEQKIASELQKVAEHRSRRNWT